MSSCLPSGAGVVPRAGVVLGAVALAVALLPGCGGGGSAAPEATATTASATTTSTSDPPGAVPDVAIEGTLDRSGDDLVARVTLTNQGAAQVWVPVGQAGSTRPRLLPAAAGDGVVDLGWVVPPAPREVEGVTPAFTFRPVAPGATLTLEATDAPPPPEALLDPAGQPVEVDAFRLCVDAFADAALPSGARTSVPGSEDVVVEVAAIDGESSRTCGPTVAA